MLQKRIPKAGFRTFEMDTLYHQSEYFRRFIRQYPQAIEELKELLPLFQSIFGPSVELDVTKDLLKTQLFDDEFLLEPETMLLRVNERRHDY